MLLTKSIKNFRSPYYFLRNVPFSIKLLFLSIKSIAEFLKGHSLGEAIYNATRP